MIESKTIAIDFDGTIVTHKFPDIGEGIGAIEVIKELQEAGHKIILFTMRCFKFEDIEDTISEAIKYCEDRGIKFYGINFNPEQSSWNASPKVFADLYIDDLSAGVPLLKDNDGVEYVDWIKMKQWLIENNFLED